MQNKPNLLNAEMNVTKAYTGGYENKCLRRNRKNKAKTNPKQSQSNPIQTQFIPTEGGSKPIKPTQGFSDFFLSPFLSFGLETAL